MIFRLPHNGSSHSDIRNFGRVFAEHRICQFSGCTYYLDLCDDIKEWFEESRVEYKLEGVDRWGEGYTNKLFTLVIPYDSHGTLFKVRWL